MEQRITGVKIKTYKLIFTVTYCNLTFLCVIYCNECLDSGCFFTLHAFRSKNLLLEEILSHNPDSIPDVQIL